MVDLLGDFDSEATQPRKAVDVLELAVGRAADMSEVLSALVQQLALVHDADRLDERGRRLAALWGPDHLGDAAPHVAVDLLKQWNEQAARLAKLALDAGIDERRTHVAEEMASEIVSVLNAVVSDLGFRPDAVGPILRHHMTAAATGSLASAGPAPLAETIRAAAQAKTEAAVEAQVKTRLRAEWEAAWEAERAAQVPRMLALPAAGESSAPSLPSVPQGGPGPGWRPAHRGGIHVDIGGDGWGS